MQIFTDHKALQWLANNTDISRRLGQWALELEPYFRCIRHKPGVQNGPADALSRMDHTQVSTVEASSNPANGNCVQCTFTYPTESTVDVSSIDPQHIFPCGDPVNFLQEVTATVPHDMAKLQREDPHLGPIIIYLESECVPEKTNTYRQIRSLFK